MDTAPSNVRRTIGSVLTSTPKTGHVPPLRYLPTIQFYPVLVYLITLTK